MSNGKSLSNDVGRKLKAEYAVESNSNPLYFSLRRASRISSALSSGCSKREVFLSYIGVWTNAFT